MAELLDALTSFGLILDGPPVLDGQIRRCRVDGKNGRPGFYVGRITPDGKQYVTFGSWIDRRQDQRWTDNGAASAAATEYFREQAEAARLAREFSQRRTAEKARRLWSQASKPDSGHGYLLSKNVKAYGIRQIGTSLVVPVIDQAGDIMSLQFIKPDGRKIFLKSGQKRGCCYPINGETEIIYIVEGYATGATIHELTGCKVLVAFDAGNLKPVAKAARDLYGPKQKIIIAADNDYKTKGNPGVTSAKDAATEILADIIVPDGINGTDFNDMAHERGPDITRLALVCQRTVRSTSVKEIMATDYPKINWAVDGIIPEGLTVLAGRPKFGKSWLMLGLAYAIATGKRAWNYGKTVQGSVHYLALEDSERRIKDRILSMEGYFDTYPENLHIYTDFPRIGEGFSEELKLIISRESNTRAVIIDTLQKIRPRSSGGKRNLYQAEYEDYEGLQRFAITYGIPIICVHHTRKSGQLKDANPMDAMSGSTGIQGVADTLIVCTRDGNTGSMFVTGREVNEEVYPMEFNRINMTWILMNPESKQLDIGPLVLSEWFKTHETITAPEVAKTFGINQRRAREKLQAMVDDGKLLVNHVGERGVKHYAPSEIF